MSFSIALNEKKTRLKCEKSGQIKEMLAFKTRQKTKKNCWDRKKGLKIFLVKYSGQKESKKKKIKTERKKKGFYGLKSLRKK